MSSVCLAQTIDDCQKRFQEYLNFNGNLDKSVRFDKDRIYLLNSTGVKEITIYEEELKALARFFENSTIEQQKQFFAKKSHAKLSKSLLDSLIRNLSKRKINKMSGLKPLTGIRIAIDPGHFATNLNEAKAEQKYLYFAKRSGANDSVKLFESQLTFNTALLVKHMLVEQGAIVFLTRENENYTSFNCTYTSWMKFHKKRSLDSLLSCNSISRAKYNQLLKSNPYKLFWDFFRDYDLANRVSKINAFNPHLTVIIHYNVDEKNVPWKQVTKKNYTMAFIGGALTGSDLQKEENKMHFLRLLLTDQLDESKKIAELTVNSFNKNLVIPVATANDAEYLANSCIATSVGGVFCRNLLLCRKINSPLVYGESLYQDNEIECLELMKSNIVEHGIKTNTRLLSAAKSYYEAIMKYLEND